MTLRHELDSERMRAAWRRVRVPGGAGVDGVWAVDFARDPDTRLDRLRREILGQRYQPDRLLRRVIAKRGAGPEAWPSPP